MYNPKANKFLRVGQAWSHARLRARQGHLPAWRQLAEMSYLKLRNGVGPAHYNIAGLYRRKFTWQQKLEYLSERDYQTAMNKINPNRYYVIANNKLATYALLRSYDIPTPITYGGINVEHGWTFDGQPLKTADDLGNLLRRLQADEVCFKLISGLRGAGFIKAGIKLGTEQIHIRVLPDGPQISIDGFFEQHLLTSLHDGYLIQEVITQHPEVARFNPSSLNTIRSWVVQREPGEWYMFFAILRMGIGNSTVDNLSAGGISSWIDVSSGRLDAATRVDYDRVDRSAHATHPTSGVLLENQVVPMWEETVELAKRAARVAPYFRAVAVDVAFGVDGPMIMELTPVPDDPQADIERGLRSYLRELSATYPA